MEQAGQLDGKRVLIVGGGGEGNGREITRAVHAAGADVCIVDVDPDRADAAREELAGAGGRAVAVVADVRSLEEIERVVATCVAELGGIDVLVTVVGGQGIFGPWVPITETTDETFDLVMDLNLRYVFRFARAVLPGFVEQGGGAIVSIGSLSGVICSPNAVAYGAAKAGLINLAKTVSAEFGRFGVRMNVLSCGLIMTPAAAASRTHGMADSVPLQRAGTPAEVAQAAVFLASDQSSYISGQNLNIDGAVTARAPMRLPNAHPSAAS